MASSTPSKKQQKGKVSSYMRTRRDTAASQGKDPLASAPTGASAAGNAISVDGENPGTAPPGPDPPGSSGPDTELGHARPDAGSQPSRGDSRAPGQREHSRKRKQSIRCPTAGIPGQLQLPEAPEPRAPQPPSSPMSRPNCRLQSELSVRGQEAPGPALRRTATKSGLVAPPALKALGLAVKPDCSPYRRAPQSSSHGSGHVSPAGDNLCQKDTRRGPDDVLCHSETESSSDPKASVVGSRVLRSRVVASVPHRRALEASPTVRPGATGRNLHSQAAQQDPVLHSSRLRSRPDRGSSPATGRKASSSSRPASSHRSHEAVTKPDCERSFRTISRSPPRRPVRMRASSPSPPSRRYSFPVLYNEGPSSSSSSGEFNGSSPHSYFTRSPGEGSYPLFDALCSGSGPSPNAVWHALIPDLDNLFSSTSGESEGEVEEVPHSTK
ncbi:EZH inhibitory protein [Psammomys obesus]|uniref:EZH inhibitory protein n=1 Tax=Psammomys obesus TaxID=48139 RepID=UPI00245340D8|nr:EZH inhibitory protein [Psammomys obesus]